MSQELVPYALTAQASQCVTSNGTHGATPSTSDKGELSEALSSNSWADPGPGAVARGPGSGPGAWGRGQRSRPEAWGPGPWRSSAATNIGLRRFLFGLVWPLAADVRSAASLRTKMAQGPESVNVAREHTSTGILSKTDHYPGPTHTKGNWNLL